MNNPVRVVSLSCLLMLLAACGHDMGDRVVSGAGLGAAGGAIGGAMVGNPVAGAAIGAAVGGAAGGLTSDRQIDLGKPVWDR